MGRLTDRVMIITGGGRGIGRAIACASAAEGAAVVVTARTKQEIDSVAKEISDAGGQVLAVPCDVSQPDSVQEMVARSVATFGRLDILVNNAGIAGPKDAVTEIPLEEWNRTLAINTTGVLLCSRAAVPHLMNAGGGNVINVSSGAGQRRPRPRVRSLAYQTSKFALEGLTNALAVRLRDTGINVNALQPGRIATRINNVNPGDSIEGLGMSLPEEVVPAALFLTTLAPGTMTGFSLEAMRFNRGFRPELRDYTID